MVRQRSPRQRGRPMSACSRDASHCSNQRRAAQRDRPRRRFRRARHSRVHRARRSSPDRRSTALPRARRRGATRMRRRRRQPARRTRGGPEAAHAVARASRRNLTARAPTRQRVDHASGDQKRDIAIVNRRGRVTSRRRRRRRRGTPRAALRTPRSSWNGGPGRGKYEPSRFPCRADDTLWPARRRRGNLGAHHADGRQAHDALTMSGPDRRSGSAAILRSRRRAARQWMVQVARVAAASAHPTTGSSNAASPPRRCDREPWRRQT